jgi:hypothetical protein
MNQEQFQQFVVEKLLAIESRVSKLEARAAMFGALAGASMSLIIKFWGTK